MSTIVTLYTQPSCVQCVASHRHVDAHGLLVDDIDVTQDAEAYALVTGLGYMRAPVGIARDAETGEIVEHWSGFDPDRISKYAPAKELVDA